MTLEGTELKLKEKIFLVHFLLFSKLSGNIGEISWLFTNFLTYNWKRAYLKWKNIFGIRSENEFSIEQKVLIVHIYYVTKSYKKVGEEFSAKYSEVLLILTIIVCGQVKIPMNIASQLCILKK